MSDTDFTLDRYRARDPVLITLYLSILLIISSLILYFQIESSASLDGKGLIGCLASCALGCTGAYLRKVYLDLHNKKFYPDGTGRESRNATLIYFYTRPLLSLPIGFAIYFFWMSGLNVSVQGKFELTGSGFLLLWGIAIVAGFNAGRIIDLAVSIGRSVQGKIEGDIK